MVDGYGAVLVALPANSAVELIVVLIVPCQAVPDHLISGVLQVKAMRYGRWLTQQHGQLRTVPTCFYLGATLRGYPAADPWGVPAQRVFKAL